MSNAHQSTEWLTMAEAARILNVHPTTLRRWANNGDIPVMVTPGGHRRFAVADVNKFKEQRHSIRPSGGIERIWASRAIERTRQQVPKNAGWMMRFDDKARERHRALGHRLMGLVLQYVTDRTDGDALLAEAHQIGHEYAYAAIEMKLPLKQALEASMFFRDALVGSTMQLPDEVKVLPEERMRLLKRITDLLNTVQLAVAEVYDAPKATRLPRS